MFDKLFKRNNDPGQKILDTAIALIKTSLAILGTNGFDKIEEHIIFFYGTGVVDYLCQQNKISNEEYHGFYLVQLSIQLNFAIGLNLSMQSIKDHHSKMKVEKIMVHAANDIKTIISNNGQHFPKLFEMIKNYREKKLKEA